LNFNDLFAFRKNHSNHGSIRLKCTGFLKAASQLTPPTSGTVFRIRDDVECAHIPSISPLADRRGRCDIRTPAFGVFAASVLFPYDRGYCAKYPMSEETLRQKQETVESSGNQEKCLMSEPAFHILSANS
jgi:hypothetical protein